MAVEFGDPGSGFRHPEVIRFINSEILMNGGGPEFYIAFRSRPWNEIEDRLRTIVADPQMSRALKRVCAWSGLALGVRVAARQREQQARRVRRLQDQVGQLEAASCALATELQRLRQERDAAATQLHFMRAALRQAVDEREVLRMRLLQIARSAPPDPLLQNFVQGLASQPCGVATWPLGAEQQAGMVARGVPGMLHMEAPMQTPASSLYVPGPPGPWDPAMQPHLPMPVPHPFPLNAPFAGGFPCCAPLPPPVVMESQGAAATAAVPPQMPPQGIYQSGLWVPVGPQEMMAPLWNQSGHGQGEYAETLQSQCHPRDSGSCNQKEDSECPQGETSLEDNSHSQKEDLQMPQGTAPLGDSSSDNQKEDQEMTPLGDDISHNQREEPVMPQGMVPLGNSSSHSQSEDPMLPQGMASLDGNSNYSQKEDPVMPQGIAPLGDSSSLSQRKDPVMPQGTVSLGGNGDHSQKEDPVMPQRIAPSGDSSSHSQRKDPVMPQGTVSLGGNGDHSQKEDPVIPQGIAPSGDSSSHSQKEDPMMPQGPASLEDSSGHRKKGGPERPQATPPGNSKSHGMKKVPKKEQFPAKMVSSPQGRKASESQQEEKPTPCLSPVNWVCSWCKAMNLPWRKACYKCKNVHTPVESGDLDVGQTH